MHRDRLMVFTLVELLVVIAIISILAGMILPAMARAVSQARATACMGNLRQMHLGLTFYADGNSGYLPYTKLGGKEANPQHEIAVILDVNTNNGSVLGCPDDDGKGGPKGPLIAGNWWSGPWGNWLASSYTAASDNSHLFVWSGRVYRTGRSNNDSNWLAFADGCRNYMQIWSQFFQTRHEGNANLLWLGGYACTVRFGYLDQQKCGYAGSYRYPFATTWSAYPWKQKEP